MTRIRVLLAVTLLIIARVTLAQTSSPTISYQAYILGSDGKPLQEIATPVHIEILNTDGPSPATLWTDDITVAISNGILSLDLGSHHPLPPSAALDHKLSVGISIKGQPMVLSPMSASPYALNVPDSSITAAKMGTDYVKSISVNGEKITDKGSDLNIVTGDGLRSTYVSSSNTIVLSGSTVEPDGKVQYVAHDPCGSNDDGARDNNTVSGGCANTIFSNLGYIFGPAKPFEYCVIGGGQSNTITNQVPSGTHNPDTEGTWWHAIGGGHLNTIIAEIVGSSHNEDTIMGASTIAGGEADTLSSPWGFIGGGYRNYIGYAKPMVDMETGHKMRWNTIGGGDSNTIIKWSQSSFIGGGSANHIGGSDTTNQGTFATIGGGDTNSVLTWGGTIGGGSRNTVSARDAGILGGSVNSIDTNSPRSFIGGGRFNNIHAEVGVIAGGDTSTIGEAAEHSVIAGGRVNTINSSTGTIAGGAHNTLDDGAELGFIGGGQENRIELLSPFSTIAGGLQNHIDSAAFAFIGGGTLNSIQGWASAITGGESNAITDSAADHNFIGGGLNNVENNPSFGVIGGGWNNLLDYNAWASTIAGGREDTIKVAMSFIGGGWHNIIEESDTWSAISGGEGNRVWSKWSTIGAGRNNLIHGDFGSMVGGDSNIANTALGFLGGGYHNYIDYNSDTAVLVGGAHNYMGWGQGSFLGGGSRNTSESVYSFLGGGSRNTIDLDAPKSVLVGGDSNTVRDNLGFIGGGCHNKVTDGFWGTIVGGCSNHIIDSLSFIGGGQDNFIQGDLSTIVGGAQDSILDDFGFIGGGFINVVEAASGVISGGDSNRIEDSRTPFSTIAGGSGNLIHLGFGSTIGGGQSNRIFSLDPSPAPRFSVIAGGEANVLDTTDHSVIGGGGSNYIGMNATGATIPGGLNLIANSYNQVVVGRFNDAWGTSKSSKIKPDDPLFTVGNGNSAARSDAFEVSNSGHSKIFEMRGNETWLTASLVDSVPIIGSRYKDNTLLAWGDVVGGTLQSNFGIREIKPGGPPGVYVIVLRINDDRTGNPVALASVSVTATLKESSLNPNDNTTGCGSITVTGLGATYPGGAAPDNSGIFIIRTYNSNCETSPRDFEFHVFGR